MDMETHKKSCLSKPADITHNKIFANRRFFDRLIYAYPKNKLKSTAVEVFSAHRGVYSKENFSAKYHTIDVNKTVAIEVINIPAAIASIENA